MRRALQLVSWNSSYCFPNLFLKHDPLFSMKLLFEEAEIQCFSPWLDLEKNRWDFSTIYLKHLKLLIFFFFWPFHISGSCVINPLFFLRWIVNTENCFSSRKQSPFIWLLTSSIIVVVYPLRLLPSTSEWPTFLKTVIYKQK